MIENNRYYWSCLKTKNASVRVTPKPQHRGVVFRVGHVIDLGHNNRTAMLENVDYPEESIAIKSHKVTDVAVPFRMSGVGFVYTSRQKPVFRNVKNLLSVLYKDMSVEKIVMDVLAPGDLLVFKQGEQSGQIKLADILRAVPNESYVRKPQKYAL